MIFLHAKSLKSTNQTIATMISIVGFIALTNSVFGMEVHTPNDKIVIDSTTLLENQPIGITPIKETESSIDKKEPATGKKSHKRAATNKEPMKTGDTTISTETDTTPLTIVTTDHLQTLLTELGNIAQIGSSGCLSCLKATPSYSAALVKVITTLTNEAVQTGQVVMSGIKEIMELVTAVQHFNGLQTKADQKIYAPTLDAKLSAAKDPLIEHNYKAFALAKMNSTTPKASSTNNLI